MSNVIQTIKVRKYAVMVYIEEAPRTLAQRWELTFSEAAEYFKACVDYFSVHVYTLQAESKTPIKVVVEVADNELGTVDMVSITA